VASKYDSGIKQQDLVECIKVISIVSRKWATVFNSSAHNSFSRSNFECDHSNLSYSEALFCG